jgi:phage terminase large subunit
MDRENWWRVYGLGEVGVLEGNIYKDWVIIDEVPKEAKLEAYGNDFGYSLDPNAVVAVYYLDGWYIFDEKLYRAGLTNNQLAKFWQPGGEAIGWPEAPVVCDSAEPKSIEELKMYDIIAVPSTKGPGSVNHGIQLIQGLKIKVTKSSVNLIKEYRNYKWRLDKDGKPMGAPENVWNHALDAVRYALSFLKSGEEFDFVIAGGEPREEESLSDKEELGYNENEGPKSDKVEEDEDIIF